MFTYTPSDGVLLQKLQVAVAQRIPCEFIAEHVELSTWLDSMLDDMCIRLSSYVLTEKLAEKEVKVIFEQEVSFEFPSSWRQHLKQQWNGMENLQDALG